MVSLPPFSELPLRSLSRVKNGSTSAYTYIAVSGINISDVTSHQINVRDYDGPRAVFNAPVRRACKDCLS